MTLGQRAYGLFATHRSWIAVARDLYGIDDRDHQQKARAVAKSYARGARRAWPIPSGDVGPIVPRTRRGPLHGADLTRSSLDLCREYGVTASGVNKARARAGVTVWADARATMTVSAPALVRAPVVVVPEAAAPTVAPAVIVAAMHDELAIGSSLLAAAVMVAWKYHLTTEEVLAAMDVRDAAAAK